jgi:hypothetical protein
MAVFTTRLVSASAFGRATGWSLEPQGACKGARCIPLPGRTGHDVDVVDVADRIGLAVAHDEAHGIWAVGPELERAGSEGRRLPAVMLTDFTGETHDLSTRTGRRKVLVAWASW